MTTQEINAYYHSTEHSEVRADLSFAISLVSDERIAIDCGCGAGSDIAFCEKTTLQSMHLILSKRQYNDVENDLRTMVRFYCPKIALAALYTPTRPSLRLTQVCSFAHKLNLKTFGLV